MTTAARPTFEPAKGGSGKSENDLGAMSKQYSSRDLPAHMKLKYRQDGQSSSSEVRNKDFRRELEERERSGRDKSNRTDRGRDTTSGSSSSKKSRVDPQLPPPNLDADDPVDKDASDEEGGSDDSDDDDTAELLAELAKIKKERAAEAAQQEAERKAEEEKIRMENIIRGNPLMNQSAAGGDKQANDFKVKRRWDDDVVFKNCTRGASEKKEKRFINDTLRSEFHKKFMEKYIK